MKRILITGASGFIGGFLVEEALRKGWDVWAGIRKTSSWDYLSDPAIHLIELNYSDATELQKQVQHHAAEHGAWDYVIHSAGITKSAFDSDFDRINNVYTRNLINALIFSGHVPEKFVFMSSLGAFGPGDEKNYTPLNPNDKPRPNTAYGRSKMHAEQFLRSLSDFPYIILRPTGVYGPREKDYLVMLKMINAGLDVSVGFRPQRLNFIYVKDLVKVCIAALESPLINKVWFVADGDHYSSQDYTRILREILRKKYVVRLRLPLLLVKSVSVFAGMVSSMTRKPALINPDKYKIIKQRNWTCDITSLKEDLGFEASYNLQKGMEETVAWYKDNDWL
jgi:nucleoside-diphosphate-sugar epimerase